ncbi:MAG: hypothetical protein QXN55_03245 [Candidatus Nitrosotenuis sp.]
MKRGVSTVVGSVFFLVLLSGGLSVSYLIIETQSDMLKAQQTIADSEIKKIQEKFTVSVSSDKAANNRLAVYVKNQGSNSLHIDNIWIINETATNHPATKYDVSYSDSTLAPGYGGDILQNNPLYMKPGDYKVKVVSAIGTIRIAEFEVGTNGPLKSKMILDPPNVSIGENATAWIFVTNTGTTKIFNVTAAPILVSPQSAVTASSPALQSFTDLEPYQSTIFSWKYKLTGAAGSSVGFTTYAKGIDEGTKSLVKSENASSTIILRNNADLDSIVTQTLLSKPEIFMIIPSPFGDASDKGVWGVNVVNPTNQPIYVSKVVINAITPRAQSNDLIFDTNVCAPVAISPTTSNWSCPASNQLVWKNTINPQKIEPKSVFPFLAMVKPGSLAGNQPDLETIVLQTNVFTTLGQFGKAGYGSAMKNTDTSLPNVYLSKIPGSMSSTNIITNMTNVKAGSTVKFNATIADFDTGTSSVISAGSRLIVNIPKGWSNVSIVSATGFDTPITPQSFADTSSQIVGVLSNDVTGSGGIARTIQFTATAPPVNGTQMYVMYILADGDVNNSFPIGPLAEIVLQVTP